MKALILSAGYGTRLYPLTKDNSKPLLPVSGEPIIDHILHKLSGIDGIEDIIVVSNNKFYNKFLIWCKKAKNKFPQFKFKILNDGSNTNDDRLGAIGDISFVLKKVEVFDDLLIVGGDNIFDFSLVDFVSFARKNTPHISIGAYDIGSIKKASRFGVVKIDKEKRVVLFEEKPAFPKSTLIAMCLYYFPKQTLKFIFDYIKIHENIDAPGRYIKWLCVNKKVYGYPFEGEWHDIGHLDEYNRIKESF